MIPDDLGQLRRKKGFDITMMKKIFPGALPDILGMTGGDQNPFGLGKRTLFEKRGHLPERIVLALETVLIDHHQMNRFSLFARSLNLIKTVQTVHIQPRCKTGEDRLEQIL